MMHPLALAAHTNRLTLSDKLDRQFLQMSLLLNKDIFRSYDNSLSFGQKYVMFFSRTHDTYGTHCIMTCGEGSHTFPAGIEPCFPARLVLTLVFPIGCTC